MFTQQAHYPLETAKSLFLQPYTSKRCAEYGKLEQTGMAASCMGKE